MPRTWGEVSSSEQFKALSAADQNAAREQYFAQVVAPRLSEEDLPVARAQFDADTRIAKRDLPRDVMPSDAGAGRGEVSPEPPSMMDKVKRGLSDIATPASGDAPQDGAVRRGTMRGVTPYAGGDVEQGPAGGGRGTVNPPMVGEGRRAGESVLDMAGRPPQGEVPEVVRDYAAESVAPREQERRDRDFKLMQGTGVASETPPEVVAGMRMEKALRGTNIGPVVQGVAGGMAELGKTVPGAVAGVADLVGADQVSEFAQGASRRGSNFQQAAMPQAEGFDRNVANIFSSVTASLPFMATGGAGAGFKGAGALMFGQTALADYGERRAAGIDPLPAAVTAGVTGAAEVLGERFGFGEQTKAVKGLMTQLLRQGAGPDDLAINAVRLLVKEVPGEQLTTAAQFLNEKYNIGGRTPEATLADYFKQVQDTLITTIGQSGIVGGAPLAVQGARDTYARADAAIDRSAGLAPQSPPAQRPPQPQQSPYDLAKSKGFFVDPPLTTDAPIAQRAKTTAVFDNLAALHGLPAAAVAKAKAAAEGKPLREVGPFFARFVSALQARGLAPADIDPDVLATVAAGPMEPPPEVKPGKTEAPAQDAAAIDAAELLDPPAEAAQPAPAATESPAAPIQTTNPDGMVGEPLDGEWRAFTPESGTKGLPRAEMPQIKAEHRGPLVNFLNARGIAHESEVEIPSNELKPTQAEFSPAKIKSAQEFKGGDRSILVSADGHVVDGHHQWMAKLDKGEPVKAIVLNAPIDQLLPIVREFPSAQQAEGATLAPAGDGANGLAGQLPAVTPASTEAPTPASNTPPPSAKGSSTALNTATGEKAAPGKRETPPAARILARAGRTPNAAEPIELRPNKDGTLTPWMGGHEMLDFDSGQPIVMKAGITDFDAKKAIRDAGAVTKKVNFFPAVKGANEQDAQARAGTPTETATQAADAPSPAAAPAATQPAGPAAAGSAEVEPARVAPKAKTTRPVRGSTALGQISDRMGGLSPDLLADLSSKVQRTRTDKMGKKTSYTAWDNPRHAGHGPLFRKGGTADMSEVARVLEEEGYIERGLGERDPGAARQEAETIIKAELAKGGSTLRKGDAGAIEAEMRARADDAMGPPDDIFDGLTDEDLAATGYTDLPPELKEATERLLALAEAEGIDTEALREDAARLTEGQPDDVYHAQAQRLAQEALAAARPGPAKDDASPAEAGDRNDGQAAGSQGEEGRPGLTLEAPTKVQVLAQQAAIEREQADKEAAPDKPASKFTGEQPDMFNTQASVFEDLSRRASQMYVQGYQRVDTPRVSASLRLGRLIRQKEAGKLSDGHFEIEVKMLAEELRRVVDTKDANRLMSERERGADYVREKLLAARRRGDISADTAEFALWALDKNPQLAEGLGISVRKPAEGSGAGQYNPAASIMTLFKGNENPGTAVHEILHHTERMMPADIQAAIRGEWARRLTAAVRKAEKAGDTKRLAALRELIAAAAGSQRAQSGISKLFADGVLNYTDDYQLTNPSEFWAVNATEIMSRRHAADSWIAKAKQWLAEMLEKVKGLLKLPSDAPVLRALRAVMDGIGGQQSTSMLSDKAMLQDPQSPEMQALKAISENDELFALPKSDKDTMEGITFDNDPTIKIRKTSLPGNEAMWTLSMPDGGGDARITVRKAGKYGPSPYSADFDGASYSWNTERPGDNPEDVDPDTTDVWIDVSQLKGKGQGATIYNIASTFAHNTGAIFIGDPNGVSSDAMRRRPAHMLSSALKFGTTRHLAPHPDQVRGSPRYDIPPLKWVYGDDIGNIRRLVDLNLKLLDNDFPTSKLVDFDVNTGTYFRTDTGVRIRFDAIGELVARARGMGAQGPATSLAGGATVARGSVLRALLREEGSTSKGGNGRRNDLLAGVVRLGAVHPQTTGKVFYDLSKNGAPPAPPVTTASNESGWAMPEGTRFDNFVYKFQDKNVDLKRAVAAIKKDQADLADKWDAYLQEELFHGRAAKRTQDFVDNELSPLLTEMKLRQITQDQLNEYLHARHAEEANAVIAQRNRDANAGQLDLDGKAKGAPLQDGGSGMTNAEAKAYLDKLDPAQRKRLEAVAAKVDAIIAKTRDAYVAYGLESKTVVDGWAKLFKHYVPLMREDKDGGMGIGQGFSIKGPESKHRTGSTAKVVDILANIALQREKAIVRGEKNRVAVALAGLVKMNPNADFWSFDTIPTERVLNEKTGLVETREVPNFRNKPNVLVAKILGADGQVQERMVAFNEKNERAVRMAEAMKNLDAAQLEGVLGVSAKITRYFSAINTQYNPVFGFVNLVRDVQGSAINLNSTELKDHKAAVFKNVGPALRAVYRTERGKDAKNTEMADLWQELQREGGMTGFRDLFRTSEDRAKAIEKELDPHKWMDSPLGKMFTAAGALKVPVAVAQDKAGWLFQWLSDYNQAMEGATRLAAYKVALEQGLSKQRAASLAKNLTVNFNRKGQAGAQVGALYAFFNAAMQGNARMGEVLFDMKDGQLNTLALGRAGKKIVAGGIALGAIQALALAAAGFDEDEPPEFVRERSLILPIGGKKYLTLPMPLGWHVLPNIGRIATEFALGGFKGPAKHMLKLTSVFAEAFNPIGNAGWSLQTITPTPLDPLAALAENRDWTGKPIARTSFDKTKPGFQQAKDTASTPAKWIAEGINWMSGGTEYVAGSMSPTPDQIDYLWGQATGGVGREISKLNQAAGAAITGETLAPHKIPLIGRFYGDAEGQSGQGTRFYANVHRLNEHEAQLKGLAKDKRDAEFKAYEKAHPEAKLIGMGNKAERLVQELRAQKRELLKRDAPRAQVKQVEDQISATMKQLNDAVKEQAVKAKEPA